MSLNLIEEIIKTQRVSKEDQLKNKANFVGDNGKLFLVRCMNCDKTGYRGTENYSMCVSSGVCAWCGWEDEEKS